MMKNNKYPQYTTDYISGVMSLRKPQIQSLKILENILGKVELSKDINLQDALKTINSIYPTCTSFEREFLSLTFALAIPGVVPADNVLIALIIGGASGLSATGTNQIFKQLSKEDKSE